MSRRRAGLAIAALAIGLAAIVAVFPRSPHRVSFARNVQPIFTRSCAGCHPASFPYLDLRAGHAWSQLVRVPSPTNPAFELVLPGRPELSYLLTHPRSVQCEAPDQGRPAGDRRVDPRGRTAELTRATERPGSGPRQCAALLSRPWVVPDPEPREPAAPPRRTAPRRTRSRHRGRGDRPRRTPQRARTRRATRPVLLGAPALSGASPMVAATVPGRRARRWASRCSARRDCPRGRSSSRRSRSPSGRGSGSPWASAESASGGGRSCGRTRSSPNTPLRIPFVRGHVLAFVDQFAETVPDTPRAPVGTPRRGHARVLRPRLGDGRAARHGDRAVRARSARRGADVLARQGARRRDRRALRGRAVRARPRHPDLRGDVLRRRVRPGHDALRLAARDAPRPSRRRGCNALRSCSATRSRWLPSGRPSCSDGAADCVLPRGARGPPSGSSG